ncbi:MAG: hypothetical protein ACI4C3_00365 [Bacteroides sp.]
MAKKQFGANALNAVRRTTERIEQAIERPDTLLINPVQPEPAAKRPGRKKKEAPAEPYTLCSVKIPNSYYVKFQALAKENREPLRDCVIRLAIERINEIK